MKNVIKRIIPILIILLVWIISSNYLNPLFLPKPLKVMESYMIMINNGMLLKGLIASFIRITIATFISVLISIPIGLLAVNYKSIDNFITPITGFMRYMPVTAFYPLLMMWVGIGESMKITFIFMATFVYFLPSVVLCLKEVDQNLLDTALTMGINKFKLLYKVLLPAAAPSICQTFLMMYGIGWTYVVIAEIVNAQVGLGHLINVSSARGRTDLVFVSLLTILIFSYIFDTIGQFIIKKIFKWKFAREIK